jgi:hypothetical protein
MGQSRFLSEKPVRAWLRAVAGFLVGAWAMRQNRSLIHCYEFTFAENTE